MRATLNLPDNLVQDLVKETGAKTKTRAITIAIEGYLRKRNLEKLLSLQGALDLEENWREMETLELKEVEDREQRRGRKNNR
jgi:hypothetical protein